ncbi:MAG: YqgE/AlgH family protein [Verrucomicrobiales bacterium]|nr:YqgE/AlgH family protein [Verrucomicrobiales bacterium]
MNHDLKSEEKFQGNLLLAVPSMKDPNFSRSVILVAAHSEEHGAFGYVMNRPLNQKVEELMSDEALGSLGQVGVFLGGPVATDKLAFASMHWDLATDDLVFRSHLSVQDAHHEMSMGHEVRGFVGYSGWTTGQLEKEVQGRSWILTQVPELLLKHPQPDTLWRTVLQGMGPLFALMADTPEDVSLN